MSLYSFATLDPTDAVQGLDALERRSHALGAAFRSLKQPLKLDQRDHAKQHMGPHGPWVAQAASTRARRLSSPKHRPRRLLGRLPTAMDYRATATSVSGTSRVPWAAAHIDGARVGHGAKLPAREFLWISNAMLITAENTLGSALVNAYGGR